MAEGTHFERPTRGSWVFIIGPFCILKTDGGTTEVASVTFSSLFFLGFSYQVFNCSTQITNYILHNITIRPCSSKTKTTGVHSS
jgi:hypothetical protein